MSSVGGSGSASGSGDGSDLALCFIPGANSGSGSGAGAASGSGAGTASSSAATAPTGSGAGAASGSGAGAGSGSGSGSGNACIARGDQQSNSMAPPAHDTYPDLPQTQSSVGASYTHFSISSQTYQMTIGGAFTFVKGWVQWAIQPPPSVQGKIGGDIGLNFGPLKKAVVSGSGWRWAQEDLCSVSGYSYWDGARWQFIPQAWISDPTQSNGGANFFGIGIWSEGGVNKAQNSLKVPWSIPAWGPDDESYWATINPKWVNTIQTVWSAVFDLKRDQCPSSDPQCCRYHTQFTVSFTPVATQNGGAIIMGANRKYVRSTSQAWCMGDSRVNLPAHEFGHLIGNADEYSGGSPLDTSWTDGQAPGICDNSMMGQNMTIVKPRHFRTISQQLSKMVDTAGQKSYGFTYQAVPSSA